MTHDDIDCQDCTHYKGRPDKTCHDCTAKSARGNPFPNFIPIKRAEPTGEYAARDRVALGTAMFGYPSPVDVASMAQEATANRERAEKASAEASVKYAAIPQANAKQIGGDHYATKAIQPWDFIIANAIPYLEGCVIKYVTRWREKGGVQDLQKARHFLDKLIETETKA